MPRSDDEIPLDPKDGLNPAMGACYVCGQDNGEIILAGNSIKCLCSCGTNFITYADRPRKCPKCGGIKHQVIGKFSGQGEKITSGPCDRCREILQRTNINRCPKCGVMYACQLHRTIQQFEMGKDATSLEDAVAKGYLVAIIGWVAEQPCEDGKCKSRRYI